eukprot:scaffold32614_cov69-Phaeocystis_antarctica.AAC.3
MCCAVRRRPSVYRGPRQGPIVHPALSWCLYLSIYLSWCADGVPPLFKRSVALQQADTKTRVPELVMPLAISINKAKFTNSAQNLQHPPAGPGFQCSRSFWYWDSSSLPPKSPEQTLRAPLSLPP